MAVNTLGNPTAYRAPAPLGSGAAPFTLGNLAQPAPAYAPPAYAPTTYTPAAATQPTSTGLNGGHIAAAAGAFAGFRWGIPAVRSLFNLSSLGALGTAGVVGGAAYLGYHLFNRLTGKTAGSGLGGNTVRYGSWAGGAVGAVALARNIGIRPAGWALAGVVAAGAYAGNWLYGKLTGR